MVQRLKTAKEGWLWMVKFLYMLIGFPSALLIGIPSLFLVPSLLEQKNFATLAFCSMLWLAALVPVVIFLRGVLSRRRLLKQITKAIKAPQFFNPDDANEMYHEGDGKYLGIDTKNGTILYVHRIRKGHLDVVALTMNDWTNREVEGKGILRLYTKFPDLARIEIGTPWAQRWYDTLGAMEHKQYANAQAFKQHVHHRLEALERDLNVQIPRLA